MVGIVDLHSMSHIKRQLKDNLLSFAIPFALFQEMEANVPGSFLERPSWKELLEIAEVGSISIIPYNSAATS